MSVSLRTGLSKDERARPTHPLRSFDVVAPAIRLFEDLGEAITLAEIVPQLLEHRDQRVERRPYLVGVGRGNVSPDVGWARGEARRVGEPSSGERESVAPRRVADHLHQRARGQ